MSLNPDLVRSRVQEVEESLRRLEKIAEIPRDEFLKDADARDIACYRLLVSIEAALSLCYHVSAKKLVKVPEGYADCFGLLVENDLIEPELGRRLQRMARFRNMLVHVYWKVDYEQVYRILQENLSDLRAFCAVIVRLL